jgi:hypothetical protein
MIIIQSQPQKEVMAVDADDHLCRPYIFRFNLSEMRLAQVQVNCFSTRVTVLYARHE